MQLINVVIPTRNRPNDLLNILKCLSNQSIKIGKIVIVESSDKPTLIDKSAFPDLNIHVINTEIRSAAEQRNIGKRYLGKESKYIAFLDDDVSIERDYFSQLIDLITLTKAVGVSGVAINLISDDRRQPPHGLSGLLHRVFLLDSNKDGSLLPSGINIPIRTTDDENYEVDWLIGCSLWDSHQVAEIFFERDFSGQSLGEDVIFSVRAREKGSLFVNPSIILNHFESPIGRADQIEHYRMWVINRKRLINIMGSKFLNQIAFQIANIGQVLIFVYLGFKSDKKNFQVARIILKNSLRNAF
jgi:glycosyltransferase involved in cell wall biosynthesis